MDKNEGKAKRLVYLDYAATTPVHPEALQEMLPYFSQKFGNPSSVHRWGQEARMAVDKARQQIAGFLGCESGELYFTGTTTTSDNLAILGLARSMPAKGHVVTSAIEHHAVLDTVKHLEKEGFRVTLVPVDRDGVIDLKALEESIGPDTFLVSVMYANNEVGTVQPLAEIGRIVRAKEKVLGTKIVFHSDIATTIGWLDVNVKKLGLDMASFGSHKFGGPKGVGGLYCRQGIKISPITFGGHHENGFWPGTEPVPLIVGMAKAMEISLAEKDQVSRVQNLRDKLIAGVSQIPSVRLTGHPEKRLADIASFLVEGVEGEAMLLLLSDAGIAASSGSACTSGELTPSHVLLAMGIKPEQAHGSIRFSLGPETREDDIDYVLQEFSPMVEKLRFLGKGIKI